MLIPLACAAILAPPTLAQGLDPAQIVSTSDTTSPEPIGDQAAVDGGSAIILGGPITGVAPLAPLRVLFMEHQPNGVWAEVQAIDLPQGTRPLGDGTVAIQGDIATVFVHAQVSL